ncbi:MAG: MerR family transcriptional regulator [Pseudomonadales bacterium]|nr:MerR family transcriptional regulator [Pseudomonadales bacterium]
MKVIPDQKFRLSELAELAGIAKKTIHYYLNIGILPPPKRIHERLSLYGENHFKLIKLIQKLQAEKKLPLSFITQLFKQGDYDADVLELGIIANTYDRIVASEAPEKDKLEDSTQENAEPILVSKPTRKALVKLGIIKNEKNELAPDESKIATVLEKANSLNIPFEVFEKLQTLINEMVLIESESIIQSIDGDSNYKDVIEHLVEVDDLLNDYIRRTKSTLLRKHYEKSFEDAPFTIQKLYEKIYVPSPAFLKKYDINDSLIKLIKTQENEPTLHTANIKLAESFMAIGDYKKTITYSNLALKKSSDNIDALLLSAAGHALLTKTDEAIIFAEKAISIAPSNSKALAYYAMVCLIQGSRVGGIISPGQWLKKALVLFELSESHQPTNDRDKIDVLLMRGRAFSILPPTLGMVDDGISALNEVKELITDNSDENLSWPFEGFNAIMSNNIHFYLAEAYSLKGDSIQMNHYLEKVILSDPASNFGALAYSRIT